MGIEMHSHPDLDGVSSLPPRRSTVRNICCIFFFTLNLGSLPQPLVCQSAKDRFRYFSSPNAYSIQSTLCKSECDAQIKTEVHLVKTKVDSTQLIWRNKVIFHCTLEHE